MKNNGYIQRSIIELLTKYPLLSEPEILRYLGIIRRNRRGYEIELRCRPLEDLSPVLNGKRPSRWIRYALRILVQRGVVRRVTIRPEFKNQYPRCKFVYKTSNA